LALNRTAWFIALISLVVVCQAAEKPPGRTDQAGKHPALRVVPFDGDRAVNDLHIQSAARAVVEVRDLKERPVPGAEVTFELPASGPGAFFSDHGTMQRAVTNSRGQAATTGMLTNGVAGQFLIHVTAVSNGATGSAAIVQTNSAVPVKPTVSNGSKKWKWGVVAAIGAGAVAGIALALGSHGSSAAAASPSTSIVITPGPIVVGGPR
jgi:hypothetical protein